MGQKVIIGPDGEQTVVDLTAEEEAQALVDAAAEAVRITARDTEKTRRLSFKDDEDRQEFITQLKTATNTQIETFVRNRINVDGVSDLASAKQAMKRLETGQVIMLKLLALVIRG